MMPITDNEVEAFSKTVLSAVARFLPCKTREEADPIVDELEALYSRCLIEFSDRMIKPDFAGVVGMCAYALLIYYVEFMFNSDEATKYSNSAVTLLKLNMDTYGPTMTENNLRASKAAQARVIEHAAYMAFYNEDYYRVMDLIKDLELTTFTAALGGTTLSLLADAEKNPDKARAALKLLDLADQNITEPATAPHTEDVYRYAYTFYALMLVTNHEHYAGAGFVQDVPKALHVLRRGMSLLHDKQYISWLQEDYDNYSKML